MCKICVDEGRMTQEELDQANALGTDQADGAAAAFLESLLDGAIAPEPDPEADAQSLLNETVRILLAFVKQENGKFGVPQTAAETHEACERQAGAFMFKCKPTTLALSLAVLSRRYATLLDQWASLYVNADLDGNEARDVALSREEPTTPEAEDAVMRAVTRARTAEHKIGMYL